MTLPVFVINLDRRPDRWAAMSAQLDRLGIGATRIPAVDARLLAAQEDWERVTNGDAPVWTVDPGAVACAWSHRKALRAFLDTGERAALILEDDAELADDTPSLLESVEWWPPEARVIRLETGIVDPAEWRSLWLWPVSAETPSGRTVHRFERFAPGTAAFLINREAAASVLATLAEPVLPIDHLLFDHRCSPFARELRALQIVPGAARQIEEARTSDLAGLREGLAANWRKYDRPRWRRLPGKARCWLGITKPRRQGVYYSPTPAP